MASEVFRDMLSDKHLGSPKEGTEENPIRMEKISNVSLSQVKAFYKVINCRSVLHFDLAKFWRTMLIQGILRKAFRCGADLIGEAMV